MTTIRTWMAELKRSTRRRLKKQNKSMSQSIVTLQSTVEEKDSGKYKLIFIGGINRFAVWSKDGQIYEARNEVVNKKKCHGPLERFNELDWEPYYPVRKSLYDWQNEEETTIKKRKRKTCKRVVVEIVSTENWPYTAATSRDLRDLARQHKKMGNERDAVARNIIEIGPGRTGKEDRRST